MNFLLGIGSKLLNAGSAVGSNIGKIWTGTKAALGLGAGGAAAEVAVNGAKDSSIIGFYENVRDGLLASEAKAGVAAGFEGFYQFMLEIANLIGLGTDNGFRNFFENRLGIVKQTPN